MQFLKAALYVYNADTLREAHVRDITCAKPGTNKSDWIEYREHENSRTGKTAEVRRYSGTKRDEDNDPKLLDWNTIWSPTVTFIGDRVAVTGFMRGTQGLRQDGLCAKHGERYCSEDEEGEPFVRVEWILS